jgi:hypothetical protein
MDPRLDLNGETRRTIVRTLHLGGAGLTSPRDDGHHLGTQYTCTRPQTLHQVLGPPPLPPPPAGSRDDASYRIPGQLISPQKFGYYRGMDASEATIPPGRYTASISDLILMAASGPLKIVEQLRPSYGPRCRQWIDDLGDQYGDHLLRDGSAEALGWLMAQVSDPKLPDRRRGKSAVEDEALLRKLRSLKTALAPMFRDTKGSPKTRLMRIGPVVSEVLGRPWKPPHTVTGNEPLTAFCYDLLGTSAARVSQVRRRFIRVTHRKRENLIAGMELLLPALRAAGKDDSPTLEAISSLRAIDAKLPAPSPKKKSPRPKK